MTSRTASFLRVLRTIALSLLAAVLVPATAAADWLNFRGPESAGVTDEKGIPLTWSATENVRWKRPLPGFGASSPIVVGKKIFVTAYSGYGLDRRRRGDQDDLTLHLLCVDLESGDTLWEETVEPRLPVKDYEGWLPQHGYASSTPASDGESVYVFFGRSGVHAFDLEGKPLWRESAGSGTHSFGTAASPLLHEGLVIINACVESGAIIAFDKRTGKEVWRTPGIEESWSTPIAVEAPGGSHEVVVSMEDAVLGLHPRTGKELWRCAGIDDYVCPTPIVHEGVIYALGGRHETQSLAVRAGGRGNVTDSHRLWRSREGSKIPSPVHHDGHLYWVQHQGIAHCVNAKTGEPVYERRLEGIGSKNKTYASALLAEGRLYVVTCYRGTFVLEAKPDFRQLAHNDLGDESVFNASPAAVDGRLILRSDRHLYSIGEETGRATGAASGE